MRHAAEFAQIEIPLERAFRQAMLANPLQQQFIRSHALRAADDLAVAFRRQHVYAQRQLSTLGVRLHVKRFYLRRIAMHHDWPVELR